MAADITQTGFDSKSEKTHNSVSDVPESGSGGTTLEIWKKSRVQKLSNLAGGTFINNSSFPLPPGAIGNGFDNTWSNDEHKLGINADGQFLDERGKPLAGEAKIIVSGQEYFSETASGYFRISGNPPIGVLLGQSTRGEQYGFRFSPSSSGINYTKDNIGTKLSIGTITYGAINGTVTDFNGNPVQGVAVKASGASAITGPSGSYQLKGPGGSTVNLKSLYGSHTESANLQKGKTNIVDFQFPRLQVTVLNAGLEAVENAKVEINGKTYNTGPSGNVTIDEAKLQSYDIVVMEKYNNNGYNVDEQGQEYIVSFKPGVSFGTYGAVAGAGVKVEVIDGENGKPVKDCEVIIDGQGVAGLTDRDGVVDLIGTSAGEDVDIIASPTGNRYSPSKKTVSIPNSGDANISIELERNRSSPTY